MQRAVNIVLVVVGLLAVLGLMAVGYNVYRAAGTGPAWKRRLVAAGLLALAMLGVYPSSGCGAAGNATAGQSTAGQSDLAATREWSRLTKTWREAEDVASSKRGDYPFDEKGKKALLAQLEQASKDIDSLATGKHLTEPETGLLRTDLRRLVNGVQEKRPTEERNWTCYEPMAMVPGNGSLQRIQERLALLEQLAAAGTAHREVVEKVLVTVKQDIAALSDENTIRQFPEAQRPEMIRVRDAARVAVERLEARLNAPATGALEQSREWSAIVAAWREAEPLAKSGQSTTAQREAAKKHLDEAVKGAATLVSSRLLAGAEQDLLAADADRLVKEIYAGPPTDQMVTCYDMAYIPPVQTSMGRLTQRLPLLERLAKDGTIHRAAIEKVLPAIEADIVTLSKDEELKKVGERDRTRMAEMRRQAQAAVDQIKKLLAAP